MDNLLDRIAKGRIKELDPAHFNRLSKLPPTEIQAIHSHYVLVDQEIRLALKGDKFCLEAYGHFTTTAKLELATKYLEALKNHAGVTMFKKAVRRRKSS